MPRNAVSTKVVVARTPLFLTLSEQVAQRIADEIVEERVAPGSRLKEVDLASAYQVSRASIREALRLLENRGLVRIEPRRGARVTLLSAEEVDDLYEIRAGLLTIAARRVAARADPALVGEARMLLERAAAHAGDPNHGRYFETVYALSRLIAQAAGSERLASLILSFSQQVARYTRLSLRAVERRRRSVQAWKRLVRAIELGDIGSAEEAMRQLVVGSQEAIREILRDQSRRKVA